MAAATKKKRNEEAYPWKAGANSVHITNLEQSILETFDIYASTQTSRLWSTALKILSSAYMPIKWVQTLASYYNIRAS